MKSKSIIFRQGHFIEILCLFDSSKGPLDLFLYNYFRHHKQLGSKDRRYISEKIYLFFRWKALIEAMGIEKEAACDLEEQELLEYARTDSSLDEHVRVSFPKELFEAIKKSHGGSVRDICLASNQQAPLTIRVNTAKISRKDLMVRLKPFAPRSDACVETAVHLDKRGSLWTLEEFSEGLFEVQDAGSQKIASFVQVMPGERVLDFCAGSGGKALAIAPTMDNKGQIFLHDVRQGALYEARRRLKRAGVQNAQIVHSDEKRRRKLLKARMDWVLVDAPCSGTGTLRRNPDMKWRFSQDMLDRLVIEQREIFAQALTYLAPGGKIVYATCSLLQEENESQADFFVKEYDLEVVGTPFCSVPEVCGMDGFYAVCMQKRAK